LGHVVRKDVEDMGAEMYGLRGCRPRGTT